MGIAPELERRRLQRIPLQGRVTGQYRNGGTQTITGISKNVSAEGMFVFLHTDLDEGSRVELVLEMPSQQMFKNHITLRCVGRVVRREGATSDGMFGIAVTFEDVEIMPVA